MLRPGQWSRRPDDVHETLRSRAAVEGASLSELLLHQTRTRETLTAYDAQYAAPAELLDAPLVICDGPLSRAPGPRCHIELLC